MIYVECKPDKELVRLISQLPNREVVHEPKGKAEIANRLRRLQGLKAMVDEDPGSLQHPYFGQLKVEEDELLLGVVTK